MHPDYSHGLSLNKTDQMSWLSKLYDIYSINALFSYKSLKSKRIFAV
jgi:hypothetical protein